MSCGRDKGHSGEHAQQGRALHRWLAAVPAQDHTRTFTVCGALLMPSYFPDTRTYSSPKTEADMPRSCRALRQHHMTCQPGDALSRSAKALTVPRELLCLAQD